MAVNDYINLNSLENLNTQPIPQELMEDMRLVEAQTGRDVRSAYAELNQKASDAKKYIDQMLAVQKLLAETMKAQAQDLDSLDPDQLNEVAQALEAASGRTGNAVSLSRSSDDLKRQISQIQTVAENKLESVRDVVSGSRRDIEDLIVTNPEVPRYRRAQQEAIVENRVNNGIREMSSDAVYEAVPERIRETETNPETGTTLDRAEQEEFMRNFLRNQRMGEVQQARVEVDNTVAVAQRKNAILGTMDEDAFKNNEIPQLMERGIITQREGSGYLSGDESRSDFLNRVGPNIGADYVERNINPPDEPPGPGDPPPGPDEDDTDPLNVRVVNEDTDPVPVTGVSGTGPLEGAGSGSGGQGGASGGQGGDGEAGDLRRAFGMQEVSNLIEGLANVGTPGGAPLAGSLLGGLGTAGRAAAQFLPLAGPAGIAAGVVGAGAYTAGSAYINTVGNQRQIERSFGTEQETGVNPFGEDFIGGSGLLQEQVSARLSNIFLGGDEIQALTDEMAKLGATAEETAEALGPAADALDKYRSLTPEMAARSARRGQQFSPIGAAEVEVFGQAMERVSGEGISTEALRTGAQSAAEVYDRVGVAGGEYAGLAKSSWLASGDTRSDLLLEGMAERTGSATASFQEDPYANPLLAATYTGDGSYMNVDMTSPEGRNQMEFLIEDIVSKSVNPETLPDKAEDGTAEPSSGNNARAIIGTGVMDKVRKFDPLITEAEVIELANKIHGTPGGFEAVRQQGLDEMKTQEKDRKLIEDDATGVTQGKQRDASDKASSGTGALDFSGTAMGEEGGVGGFINNVRRSAAFATGFNFLGPQNTQDRGTAGSVMSSEMYAEEKGNLFGAAATIAGIDPNSVMVEDAEKGTMTLDEARKDDSVRKKLENDEQLIKMGGEKISLNEMTTMGRDGELEAENVGLWGKLRGKDGIKRAGDDGGGVARVKFTGKAEQFFEMDTSDPNTMAGQTNNAQAADRTNREGAAPHSNGRQGPQVTRP